MASRQVIKLCKKIQEDVGVVCKPETFHVERMNQSFHVWNMDVDVDNSTGFSKGAFEDLDYCTTCTSSLYMKNLLKCERLEKVVHIDDNEVVIYPSKDDMHRLDRR